MSEDIKATVEAGLAEVKTQLDAKLAEHTAEVSKFGKASTELTGKIDDMAAKYADLQAKFIELAQKGDNMYQGKVEAKSIGQQFVTSEAFKMLTDGQREKVRIECKNTAITSDLSALLSDGSTVYPNQRPGVIAGDFAPVTIRSRIPSIAVSTNAVESIREDDWTNAAAETAQGNQKPESTIEFEKVSVPIRTVAHWLKVSNQLLADAPAIAAYIDTRARDGLAQRIEGQLMNGNGLGENLKGLAAAGNFTAFTPTAGANLVESINKAKYALWAIGNKPDTVFVNPADWSAMELERETVGGGQYLYGAPGTNAGTSPFGVQVVMSNAVQQGKFLIGAIASSAVIFNRSGVAVELGYVNDDFTRNLVTIRVEERLALSVDRPSGLLYGDITGS